MIATIEVETRGIPYTQMTIGPGEEDDTSFFITYRRYARRVFVGVEDYSDQIDTGVDIEQIVPAPSYIIVKTPFEQFDGEKAFYRALKFLGEIGTPGDIREYGYDIDYWTKEWARISEKYHEWRATPLPAGSF